MAAFARLSQDGVARRKVGADLDAGPHVVLVGNLDDILHDRLLLPAGAETATSAPVAGAGRANVKRRDRPLPGTGHSNCDLGGTARHIASGYWDKDAVRNC